MRQTWTLYFLLLWFSLFPNPLFASDLQNPTLIQANMIDEKDKSDLRPAAWNNIKHIVIIILENTNAENALKQPFMKSLLTTGAYMNQFYAITHPSQPNYIALVAGATLGVTSDRNVNVDGKHLGDLLDQQGKTWKAYAEGLPSTPCFLGKVNGDYARKHEPFISFKSVQNNPAQCGKIVSAKQFFNDLSVGNLPSFSLYIPDQSNDGHDTGVKFADKYLAKTFGPIFKNADVMKDTLFVVTFDEDDFTQVNRIYTVFVGSGVKANAQTSKRYTHYSLLRTVEDILAVGTLGKEDQAAQAIKDIWLQ